MLGPQRFLQQVYRLPPSSVVPQAKNGEDGGVVRLRLGVPQRGGTLTLGSAARLTLTLPLVGVLRRDQHEHEVAVALLELPLVDRRPLRHLPLHPAGRGLELDLGAAVLARGERRPWGFGGVIVG